MVTPAHISPAAVPEWVAQAIFDRSQRGAALRLVCALCLLLGVWSLLAALAGFPRQLPEAWLLAIPFPFGALLDLAASYFAPPVLLHMVPILAGLWIGIQLSAHYLNQLYHLESPAVAGRTLLAALFGIGLPHLHLVDDQFAAAQSALPLVRIGGPGTLSVDLGFAAMVEDADGIPQVIGPSRRHRLSGFERPVRLIDLRDQMRQVDQIDAVTRDGIAISAREVQIVFRAYGGGKARTLQSPYPYSEEALRIMTYACPVEAGDSQPWRTVLDDMVRSEVRSFIAGLTLDALFALQTPAAEDGPQPESKVYIPRRALTELFQSPKVRERWLARGLELNWISVGTWEVRQRPSTAATDPAIRETLISAWRHHQQAQAKSTPAYLRRLQAEARRKHIQSLLSEWLDLWEGKTLSGPMRCAALLKWVADQIESGSGWPPSGQDKSVSEAEGEVMRHLRLASRGASEEGASA
jgi:hypothetical protein